LFPQREGRVRAYVVYPPSAVRRLQGVGDVGRFIAQAGQIGIAAEILGAARAAGPLASFDTADAWVPHPSRAGVVLIGDAAATSDPTFGQGLSLTLRDVRVLRDQLVATKDWDAAAAAYADTHDRYYDVIHRVDRWFAAIVFERGPAADARRARALPLLGADPTRLPDHQLGGPDLPIDDGTRRRFFGEE